MRTHSSFRVNSTVHSTKDRSKHIKHLHLWGHHEWELISHQPQSEINFASLKQVPRGVEFLPNQFFTGAEKIPRCIHDQRQA
ncbi:hypothetical protein QQF64_004016 [Cirrhinus molitorella]|uniref:Uncharacterized protein n=1 Tax=Cirrhinus molitorella TaxID=172907 RepID=A0ABR3MN00_9TELE